MTTTMTNAQPERTSPGSWREIYPVHPCADVFPMMGDAELDALAKDIQTNGLRQPVVVWRDDESWSRQWVVLDGRNRLAALARAGIEIPSEPGDSSSWRNGTRIFSTAPSMVDPATYVISANIRRRHLTKEQQAELIVKTMDAGAKNDRATVARSFSPTAGKKGGSTTDPALAAAVIEGAKHGISKRTIQKARAKGGPGVTKKARILRVDERQQRRAAADARARARHEPTRLGRAPRSLGTRDRAQRAR